MADASKSRFEVMEGFPEDVVAIAAHGHISGADYEDTLIPLVAERVRTQGKVKLVYVIARDFAGYSAGAAWDDAKLGFLHMGDFARIAVVTDIDWIRGATRMFAPLMPCPVQVFPLAQMADASTWICAADIAAPGGPEVAASRKLPTLEDRNPPADEA